MGNYFFISLNLQGRTSLRPCLWDIPPSQSIKSMFLDTGIKEAKAPVLIFNTRFSDETRHDPAKRPSSRGARRWQSNLNSGTGMVYTQRKEPQRKRPIWPWILLSLILVALLSRAFPGDSAIPASAPTPGLIIATPAVTSSPKATAITTQTPITPLPKSLASSNNASPAATPVTVLGRGVRSDEVRALQERLITLGFLGAGQADGIFGRGTEKAVEAFQKKNGLHVDGIAGEKTLTLLYSSDAKKNE